MNESKQSSFIARVPATCLFIICVWAVSEWSFDRFWLYHSQNRVLQPSDYTVNVEPIGVGRPMDHQVSDDGRFSVRVMANGTSMAMDQVTQSLVPIIILSLLGLVVTIYVARRRVERPA